MNAPTAIPELRDELNRKTFEAVEWLLHSHARCAISDAQFSTGMDVLWMAVSGLVDDSFTAIATEASAITRGITNRLRRHFMHGPMVVTVSWTPGEDRWEYRQYGGGADRHRGVKEAANPQAARELMTRFCQKLLESGYTEL